MSSSLSSGRHLWSCCDDHDDDDDVDPHHRQTPCTAQSILYIRFALFNNFQIVFLIRILLNTRDYSEASVVEPKHLLVIIIPN